MKLLLIHCDLADAGGAEWHCVNVHAILSDGGHELDVLDISGLRDFEGRTRDSITLKFVRKTWFRNLTLLKYAVVLRCSRRHCLRKFDAIIFTFGEGCRVTGKSVYFAHAPQLFSLSSNYLRFLQASENFFTLSVRKFYTFVCRWIAKIEANSGESTCLIANSFWTLDQIGSKESVSNSQVIFPRLPDVLTGEGPRNPYSIVVVGRIVQNKNIENAISALRHLRSLGYPATLQVVGRHNGRFTSKFCWKHRFEPGLKFCINASEHEKADILSSSKFGLHCYNFEHFGIAVGEMINAGVIPIVFDGGGVRELVFLPSLRYRNMDEMKYRLENLFSADFETFSSILRLLRSGIAISESESFDASVLKCVADFVNNNSGGDV